MERPISIFVDPRGVERLMEEFSAGSRPDGKLTGDTGDRIYFRDVPMVADANTKQEFRLVGGDLFYDENGTPWTRKPV